MCDIKTLERGKEYIEQLRLYPMEVIYGRGKQNERYTKDKKSR